jgi:hypothetical protein
MSRPFIFPDLIVFILLANYKTPNNVILSPFSYFLALRCKYSRNNLTELGVVGDNIKMDVTEIQH